MAASMMAPAFMPGAQPAPFIMAPPQAPAPSTEASVSASQANTVAHESNGMVYYYNSAQLAGPPQVGPAPQYTMTPHGGLMGMGGMMTPPSHFYYSQPASGMFYANP